MSRLDISEGVLSRPEDWSLEERLMALQESHGLVGEALNGWCRERGLFAHHLVQWRADFCTAGGTGSRRETAQELRDLKQSNVQLQRELKRKEKALVEAAALLVLQKKWLCRDNGGMARKFREDKESLHHQRIELIGSGSGDAAVLRLAFPDHMHRLNA